MDIYDRIELRTKELGISKAHISTTLGMARTWLNGAQSYQTFLPPETVDKIAIRAGVDMRTLAELLGHSDVAFTMQVYGHSDDAMKAAAMERIHNIGKASKGKNAASDGESV